MPLEISLYIRVFEINMSFPKSVHSNYERNELEATFFSNKFASKSIFSHFINSFVNWNRTCPSEKHDKLIIQSSSISEEK